MERIRLLLIDMLFPNCSATWRTVEINWLLSAPDYDTDILVSGYQDHLLTEGTTRDCVATLQNYAKHYQHLRGYNILIFNPKYNALNCMNESIDGTLFNGKCPADFLFTRHHTFNPAEYEAVYSIFLAMRERNDWLISHLSCPSITKIYPGGGYHSDPKHGLPICSQMEKRGEYAIYTQPFMEPVLSRYLTNLIPIYGGPLIPLGATKKRKELAKPGELHICFTAFSFGAGKGYDNYLSLARYFAPLGLPIYFHVVGPNPPSTGSSNILSHGYMDPEDLERLYQETIDVIVSPVIGGSYPDGFPLGGEAIIQGCIPIQCDPHDGNIHCGFDSRDSLIMKTWDLDRTVGFIMALLQNPQIRLQMSWAAQDRVHTLFDPFYQLGRVDGVLKKAAMSYRKRNTREHSHSRKKKSRK